jgi:PhzF family phenazine biosynthesis protein
VAEIRLRTVDAFTDKPFTGNPAAVVMLDEAPPDDWLAAVARETGVSDTGFVIREVLPHTDFHLRWFTPAQEVDLCGHATLAAAHCLFEDGAAGPIRFATRSGVLTVTQQPDGSLVMDFPAQPPTHIASEAVAEKALDLPVEWTGRSHDGFFLLAVTTDERSVRNMVPDLNAVAQLDASAVIVTAPADPGAAYDFVSRLFAPNVGIAEDPVTGSSHTVLAPYWAARLARRSLTGLQASARPGLVGVELNGDRVLIMGRAVTVIDSVLRATANPK